MGKSIKNLKSKSFIKTILPFLFIYKIVKKNAAKKRGEKKCSSSFNRNVENLKATVQSSIKTCLQSSGNTEKK